MIDRRTLASLATLAVLACAGPLRAAELTVHKSPYCGCCTKWIEHVRAHGFAVRVVEMDDVSPVARGLGVPDRFRACHSAQVAGYFVEGHVPAADIARLLSERPEAAGIAVPGMPAGAPGMEQGASAQPFDTLIVGRAGTARVFVRHAQASGPPGPQRN